MGVFRLVLVAALLWPLSLGADVPRTFRNPFPKHIAATDGSVTVGVVEFATLPIVDGYPALMMKMVDEPGAGRLFVNDISGILYGVSYDGGIVTPYLDLKEPRWKLDPIPSVERQRGFQSFAFHPQFAEVDTPGFGRFYTFGELTRRISRADFGVGGRRLFDTVLLEWRVHDPKATFYDGGPPREMMRIGQPFEWHNGRQIAFNPGAVSGDADFGLLYLAVGDGGYSGDPLNLSQDLGQVFGKILRIDPLGTNSATGTYGIPANNPFIAPPPALGEIYAYGLRSPQDLSWDPCTGRLFVADAGQHTIEEVNMVVPGANLGWNLWEGSFRFEDYWQTIARRVRDYVLSIWDGTFHVTNHQHVISLRNPRADAAVTYPVIEFDHLDPLFGKRSHAVTGPVVYRHQAIPPLTGRVLFGELVSGEVFYFNGDNLPDGGQDAIRRVLFRHDGEVKSFLRMVREKAVAQGRMPGRRADLRFGTGPDGQLFLLNKHDNTIRRLVAVEHSPRGTEAVENVPRFQTDISEPPSVYDQNISEHTDSQSGVARVPHVKSAIGLRTSTTPIATCDS